MIGPFPFVLLAFAVLGGIGNIIAAISVKFSVNFHVLLILLALLVGSKKLISFAQNLLKSPPAKASTINGKTSSLISATGSTAVAQPSIVQKGNTRCTSFSPMEALPAQATGPLPCSVSWKTLLKDCLLNFQNISSVFPVHQAAEWALPLSFSLLHERKKLDSSLNVSYLRSARSFLEKDFLTFTLSHMLGPDYLKYIFHINNRTLPDRAGALEQTLEEDSHDIADSLKPSMATPMSELLSIGDTACPLPVLCINTTRMQDGNPGVVTNIKMSRQIFNNRVDVLEALNDTLDMRLSTASILGARFPYISPAGRIDQVIPGKQRVNQNDSMLIHYFVDGGYFDNSGAGVVQEMIRAILLQSAIVKDSVFRKRVAKLEFTILHITNSPTGVAALNTVSPLKNDLLSPMLTIMGAYDMQTTVNDKRLENFLTDISDDGICAGARYIPLHLYKDTEEKRETGKKETN